MPINHAYAALRAKSKRMALNPAYAALLAESKRMALPVKFKRDLSHWDRQWVSKRDPSAPFMWALHAYGTHTWDVTSPQSNAMLKGVPECHPEARFYLWDGVGLIHLATVEAAREAIHRVLESLKVDQTAGEVAS